MSQTLDTVRRSLVVLEASLQRLTQLQREALAAGQDTAEIDAARIEAQAERNRLGIIQAHLEAAATTIELAEAPLRELESAAHELAGLIQANARLDVVLEAVSRAVAAARQLNV